MSEYLSLILLFLATNHCNYNHFKNFLICETGYFTRKDRVLCFGLSLFGPLSTFLIFSIQGIVRALDFMEKRNEILEDYR